MSSLVDRLSSVSGTVNGDGPDCSSTSMEEMRRALDVALCSLGGLGEVHEQREIRVLDHRYYSHRQFFVVYVTTYDLPLYALKYTRLLDLILLWWVIFSFSHSIALDTQFLACLKYVAACTCVIVKKIKGLVPAVRSNGPQTMLCLPKSMPTTPTMKFKLFSTNIKLYFDIIIE